MPSDPAAMGREIVAECLRLGFALAGVAAARPSDQTAELAAWLDAAKHGEMDYMAETAAERAHPDSVLRGARSVIMVADQYAPHGDANEPSASGSVRTGRIARYAQGRDYHRVIKKRLHGLSDRLRERYPGAKFRTFVDTAPVLEREQALRAGLGWVGKHTLIIHPKVGSYVLLGGVFTTLDLVGGAEPQRVADACGTCTRCIEACPTGAITPYSVDGSRCVSYLTIEHRSEIAPEFWPGIGDWLYGCDVCQDVCPHNTARPAVVDRVNAAYAPARRGFDLLEVLGWDESARRDAFATSTLKRVGLAAIRRNAVIAAANRLVRSEDAELLARLRAIATDGAEDPLVRATAARAVGVVDERRASGSAA